MGRPKKISDTHRLQLMLIEREKVSDRTVTNRAHCGRAISTLGYKPAWKWLGLASKEKLNVDGKMTLLAELGRIADPANMRMAAAALCAEKPATMRIAIQFVRRWRLGVRVPAELFDLANELHKVCNDFYKNHRDVNWSEISQAMDLVNQQLPRDRRDEEEAA